MKFIAFTLVVAAAQVALAAEGEAEARKSLAGTWAGGVENGATGHQLTITTENISGTRNQKQFLGEGKFTLDTTQKPWRLDATGTKGSPKGKTYLGICLLDGDALKWCVATPGNERPKELATKDSNFLLVLKRQKDK
jgi:uncharacterized protein (TIGR03067 family)